MADVPLVRAPSQTGATIADVFGRVFVFDAVTDESATDALRLTDHPTEEGSDISDHAIRELTRLSLSGVVSNTPLGKPLISALPDRMVEAYETLLAMMEARQPVIVTTGLRVYVGMMIVDVTQTRTADAGRNVLPIAVELRAVKFVRPQFVKVPPEILEEPVRQSGATEADLGTQEEEVEPEQEERSRSVLLQMGEWVFE